jgi:hypothetical protein
MEISDVRRRVKETMDRARRAAVDRRARADEASHEYEVFLTELAVPLFRQIAGVLRAEGYMFNLFTPGGSVRLMSDRSSDDYIELTLDTTGPNPEVVGHSRRGRGQRVLESETPLLRGGRVRDLKEEDVLKFVLKELEPFVER